MRRLSQFKANFFRKCYFCVSKTNYIDYKNVDFLNRFFISPNGQMKTPSFTGVCSKCQRRLSKAIKRSREIGLLPFTID